MRRIELDERYPNFVSDPNFVVFKLVINFILMFTCIYQNAL